jgi:hypothetical protein
MARDCLDASELDNAAKLLGTAINRLLALGAKADLSDKDGANQQAPANELNSERQCLLGGAYKRMALIQLQAGKKWPSIQHTLLQAHAAYASGEGQWDGPSFSPYAQINRLQLAVLLNLTEAGLNERVDACRRTAQQRYASSFGFWDGVMSADAEVARQLAFTDFQDQAAVAACLTQLLTDYQAALAQLNRQAREFDSLLDQLRILARLFNARAGGKGQADMLNQLAHNLAEENGNSQAPTTVTVSTRTRRPRKS